MALRGKDPVETHVNTILDYSFYWFMGIYDYYLYTGDVEFLKQIYPKMVFLMKFCMERRNKEGMVEGLPGDLGFSGLGANVKNWQTQCGAIAFLPKP